MNQAPQSFTHWALQLMVIVCAALLVLTKSIHSSGEQYESEVSEAHNVDRNERSTPRSFVLPATPGIAFEQERQVVERKTQGQITTCVGRLKDLGYDVGDGSPMVNVQLLEAIYKFQGKHKLPATGHLDSSTMKVMGCS